MGQRIAGIVKQENTGRGLPDLQVRVFPIGWIDRDDCLGKATTDKKGNFSIELDLKTLRSHHIDPESSIEVVIRVSKPNGWLVHESKRLLETDQDLKVEIHTPERTLGGKHVVSGTLYDARSGSTLGNLFVEVWDEDFILNDFLGSATADMFGHYRVSFERDDFLGVLDMSPDVYIKVKNQDGTILHRSSTRKEVGNNTIIDAHIRGSELAGRVADGPYKWKTFYNQEGTHVSIRIRLVPDSNVKENELVVLRDKWKKGIEEIWSNRYACCCDSDIRTLSDCSRPAFLTFEVQWVDKNPHYTVQVRKGPAPSNMLLWDTEDSEVVAAHHFGHMLGLEDEYSDPYCPSRIPVDTGTLMDDGMSVVSRHMNRLCQFINQNIVIIPHRGASEDLVESPQSRIDSKQTAKEEITQLLKAISKGEAHLEAGDKIIHRIRGGALGDRYDWCLEILHDGKVKHTIRDVTRKRDVVYAASLDSPSMIRLIKNIISSGVNKTRLSEQGYLPDSLMGCFTIEINRLHRSWIFLASPIQRRMQRCRIGKEIAAVNRLMLRVAAMTSAEET